MPVTASAVFEAFHPQELLLSMDGPNVPISAIAPADDCGPGHLVFVDQESYLASAQHASTVVTRPEFSDRLRGPTVLTSPNVKLAQALIAQKYFDRDLRSDEWPRIHPSAVIHETAAVPASAFVGPNAVVGRGARIGERCVIMANTVVEHDAVVGDDTVLHPGVVVGYGCRIGRNVIVKSGSILGSEGFGFAQDGQRRNHRIPQRGVVVIEDRVVIGANCCIDRATYGETRIGAGTVMDNLCHIAHNVQVGEDCILTAFLCVAGSTRIGRRVITSGQTGILDHVRVADDTTLVHRAGVSTDITTSGTYGGAPVQPLKEYMKNVAVIHRLAELRALVKELDKKVAALKETRHQ